MTDDRKLSHSQNFLKNPDFVESLIGKTDINSSDLVVEIGPGKGIITRQLLKYAGQILAVEIDKKLETNLSAMFSNNPKVNIIQADFLKWQLPKEPYKVFANIPFNMTADIVKKLIEDKNAPEVAYLIMQDRAAERFMGKPIAKDSQTSILLKPWFDMQIVAHIDKREFIPTPNINAVLFMFQKKASPQIDSQHEQLFRDFVIYAYNQWKPTILEALGKVFSSKQRSIISRELRIEKVKPSDLKIEQWLKLFDSFIKYAPEDKKQLVKGAEQRLVTQQSKLQKLHRTR